MSKPKQTPVITHYVHATDWIFTIVIALAAIVATFLVCLAKNTHKANKALQSERDEKVSRGEAEYYHDEYLNKQYREKKFEDDPLVRAAMDKAYANWFWWRGAVRTNSSYDDNRVVVFNNVLSREQLTEVYRIMKESEKAE
jgi:hypothetical protein